MDEAMTLCSFNALLKNGATSDGSSLMRELAAATASVPVGAKVARAPTAARAAVFVARFEMTLLKFGSSVKDWRYEASALMRAAD
jgi:hypothetical protein